MNKQIEKLMDAPEVKVISFLVGIGLIFLAGYVTLGHITESPLAVSEFMETEGIDSPLFVFAFVTLIIFKILIYVLAGIYLILYSLKEAKK